MSKAFDEVEFRRRFPKCPDAWKRKDVGRFLKFIEEEKYELTFSENYIDGTLFLKMDSDEEIWEEIGISQKDKNHLRKCYFSKKNVKLYKIIQASSN